MMMMLMLVVVVVVVVVVVLVVVRWISQTEAERPARTAKNPTGKAQCCPTHAYVIKNYNFAYN